MKKLCLVLMICLTVSALAACEEALPEPYIYIALGDSVSAGYGVSDEERHTAVFLEKLRDGGYTYIEYYINKAVNGYTTTTLLELLEGLDEDARNNFQNARIVTLNIGGNNILTPFMAYLADSGDIEDIMGDIISGAISEADGIRGLLSGGLIASIMDAVTAAASVLFGDFTPELEAAFEQGVQIFDAEFREIAAWLETHAPRATVIVNTIYNPLSQQLPIIPAELSARARELIQSMNGVIFEESEARGFLVADIYSRFAAEPDAAALTAFNLNPFAGDISIDIIHPNAGGHAIIAEVKHERYLLEKVGD